MHLLYQKTAKNAVAIRFVNYSVDIILRAIQRSEEFDLYAIENPCEAFKFSESVFRTEYGSPITSHSFREVLARVETDLIKNCEDRYGFKWTKHVTLIPLGICILPIYKLRV